MQKRTARGWFEYLNQPGRELDLSELMALTLLEIRDYSLMTMKEVRESRAAAEHAEGMLGAIDQFAASLAERSGIPYAASATVREALDAQRDDRRRLAADQRAKRLQEGERAV